MQIADLIPDAEVLLSLSIEELAFSVLQVASTNLQNNMVHRNQLDNIDPEPGRERPYPARYESDVSLALREAVNWIEVNGLLLPALGTNGNNGWRVFSRRGRQLLDETEFTSFRQAAAFPKSMLHPSIADRVWITLSRGELSDAVFAAFRTVEESVRSAGNFAETDYGVDLMRRAFNPDNGPLTDENQPKAEREALMHLFAGAIGSYKNPHSHRTVTITDPKEAQEMVMLASHLLRIVESRSN